jgi:hypothetical protein
MQVTLRGVADIGLAVAGLALSVVLAVGSAIWEAFATSLHIGDFRAPWAILAAVLGNLFLVWFARTTIARRWAVLVPAAAWTATMVAFALGGRGGDVLLPNTWVGYLTFLGGLAAFAVPIFALWGAPPRRPDLGAVSGK